MKIEACMGSSCHAKGAGRVLELLKKAIKDKGLSDKVELAGSLCFGHCGEPGANLKINDEVFTGITVENFDDFFKAHVTDVLK